MPDNKSNQTKNPPSQAEAKISWQSAPEHFTKEPAWYFFSVVFSLLLIAISLWQKNILFAIFIFMAEGSLVLMSFGESKSHNFSISARGLSINSRFFPWADFSEFSIDELEEEKPFSNFHFYKSNNFSFHLKIPIPTAQVAKIKSFLHNYLTEVEHQPSLVDSISDILGF